MDSKPLIKEILDDLMVQIKKSGVLKSQDISKTEDLKLKSKVKLYNLISKSFMDLYKDAQALAKTELMKMDYASPLNNKKFMQTVEEETWDYIGDWEYSVLKRARVELTAAVKDGKPLDEIDGILYNDLTEM